MFEFQIFCNTLVINLPDWVPTFSCRFSWLLRNAQVGLTFAKITWLSRLFITNYRFIRAIRGCHDFISRTTKCSRPNGSPKGQRSAVILGMKEFSYSRHSRLSWFLSRIWELMIFLLVLFAVKVVTLASPKLLTFGKMRLSESHASSLADGRAWAFYPILSKICASRAQNKKISHAHAAWEIWEIWEIWEFGPHPTQQSLTQNTRNAQNFFCDNLCKSVCKIQPGSYICRP